MAHNWGTGGVLQMQKFKGEQNQRGFLGPISRYGIENIDTAVFFLHFSACLCETYVCKYKNTVTSADILCPAASKQGGHVWQKYQTHHKPTFPPLFIGKDQKSCEHGSAQRSSYSKQQNNLFCVNINPFTALMLLENDP